MAEIEITHPEILSISDLATEISSGSSRSSQGKAFARVWRAASVLIGEGTSGVFQDKDGFSFTSEGREAVLSWVEGQFGNEASTQSVRRTSRHRFGDKDALGEGEGCAGMTSGLPWDKNPELVRIVKNGFEAKRQLAEEQLPNFDPDEGSNRDTLQKTIEEGESALGELMQANEGLIRKVISRHGYWGGEGGLGFQDLLQAGRCGILEAAEGFDPDKGTEFSTYAWPKIRHEVGRETANNGRTIRLPINFQEKLGEMGKQEAGLTQTLGREPMSEELAEAMGFSTEKVEAMKVWSRWPVSLQKPVFGKDGEEELIDLLPDQGAVLPELAAEQEILREKIREVLDTLLPREQKVLGLLFGIDGQGSHTETEVAEKLGRTRGRVNQIKQEALAKLKDSPYAERLKEWY